MLSYKLKNCNKNYKLNFLGQQEVRYTGRVKNDLQVPPQEIKTRDVLMLRPTEERTSYLS